MTAPDRTPGTPEYEARLRRARTNLADINSYLREHGYPVDDDPAEDEYIAQVVAKAHHLSPELARRITRLLAGGRHG